MTDPRTLALQKLPHNKPSLGMLETAAAARVLDSGWVATGPETSAFESELCSFFGLDDGHAVVVSSGSAALYLALQALVSPGANIGLPAYCCAALRNAVGMANGTPTYLDCAVGSPNLDISTARGQSLDAMMLPSMYGLPAGNPSVLDFPVIEDIAQSFGARIDGRPIGLRSAVGICSFYATKMFTSGGQGGAVISTDTALIDQIKDYLNFDDRGDTVMRFNFQMTDMQAAVGRVQLGRLAEFTERRHEIFERYRAAGIPLLDSDLEAAQPVRYRAVARVSDPAAFISHLAERAIGAINPLDDRELLGPIGAQPNAHAMTQETVSLPVYPTLLDSDIDRVIDACDEFLSEERR